MKGEEMNSGVAVILRGKGEILGRRNLKEESIRNV